MFDMQGPGSVPGGTALPGSPPLPSPRGSIGDCRDAGITPETVIPPWYGERLDLDYAICACFASARTEQEKREQREAAAGPPARVYEPGDWAERMRRYYDEHPRTYGKVLVPVPV